MPKRKRNKESLDYIKKKIRRLKKKLSKRKQCSSSESDQSSADPQADCNIDSVIVEDSLLDEPDPISLEEETQAGLVPTTQTNNDTSVVEILPEPQLDEETLQILGENPSITKSYGKVIQNDIAVRFQFISGSGLNKELRKQLIETHLPPANCKLIDSPSLNPEIRVAITDIVLKRDKALQVKQRQLCSAIASLGEAITLLLGKDTKDPALLKLLMDTGRILCDCQYNESITRRNFLLAALKKDLKDQLKETKIDQLLFGEQLADTLKTAKAINKSGSELKASLSYRGPSSTNKPTPSAPPKKNLNWKAPPPTRRLTGSYRARETAPQRRHGTLSKASRQTSSRGRH